jgi:hypothetical protein
METIFEMIADMVAEAIVTMVAYLVDPLKWWRLTISLLVAAVGAWLLHAPAAQAANGCSAILWVVFPVIAICSGLVWEYYSKQP